MARKKSTIFAVGILLAIICSSCERQCVCYNYTTDSAVTVYNSYSKSDCDDWEKYYQTDIHINPHGHEIECNYEKK